MNTKQELLEKLKNNLGLEILARDTYTRLLQQVKDTTITRVVANIRDEEITHIIIVKKLIDLVSGQKEAAYKKPVVKKEDIFKNCNTILLVSGVETYMHYVLGLVEALKKKIIYISYNKIPKYIKNIMQEHGISPKNMVFINCIGVDIEGDINIRPEDLTKLSLAIKETTSKLKDCLVIVDMVPAFSIYNSTNIICRFVALINDDARKNNYRVLWISTDDPNEKELNSKISQFCDKTVR